MAVFIVRYRGVDLLPESPSYHFKTAVTLINAIYTNPVANPTFVFFFLNDTPPPDISPLPLPDALPISHSPPITFAKQSNGTFVEVAMQYHDGYSESIFTFVNNIYTVEGGTHLIGFKAGLARAFIKYEIGRAHAELQSQSNIVCRLLLEK